MHNFTKMLNIGVYDLKHLNYLDFYLAAISGNNFHPENTNNIKIKDQV